MARKTKRSKLAHKKKRSAARKRSMITELKRFDYGRIQFVRLLAPISFVMAGLTLLKVYEISFSVQQIVAFAVVSVIGMYLIGFVWDKSGLVEEEIEYINERNRFVRAMLKDNWIGKLGKARIKK